MAQSPLVLSMQITADSRQAVAGVDAAAESVRNLGRTTTATSSNADGLAKSLSSVESTAQQSALAAVGASSAESVAFRSAMNAATGHSQAVELNRTQMVMFASAAKHSMESLASGLPITTILTQQGLEVADAFGMGEHGVGGTLSALGRVFNPVVLGAGALVVGIGLLIKAGYDYEASMQAAMVATTGLGRASGLTAGDLDTMARKHAETADLSVSATRSIATEYARTGRIGSDVMGGLVDITKNFAVTVGTDADGAAKMLAEMFRDPAKGAQTLSEKLGLVDTATVRSVQHLVEENRVVEAQKALLDAIAPRLVKASEATSQWAQDWESLAKKASNAYDAIGRGLTSDQTLPSDSLEDARKKVARAQSKLDRATGDWNKADAQEQLTQAKEMLAVLEKQAEARKKSTDEAERDRSSAVALQIAGSTGPDVQEILRGPELQRQIAALRSAQSDPKQTPENQAIIAAGIDARERAYATLIPEQEKANRLAQIDQQIAEARDPLTRADLIMKRQEIDASGQVISTTRALASAELAHQQALQAALGQTRTHILDLTDEADARKKVNDAVAAGTLSAADADRQVQLGLQLRPLQLAAEKETGAAKEEITRLILGQTQAEKALADQQKRSQALQAIRSDNDEIEQLKLEIALIGQSEAARAKALEVLKAEQKIRQMGLDTESDEAGRIREGARAKAEDNTQLERMKDAWNEISSAGGQAIDTMVSGLADAKSGMEILTSVSHDLYAELLKLAISNPLKNALFGTNLGTLQNVGGGGLFGSLLSLFGIQSHAGGGRIQGPGTGTSDSILSWMSDGEYVINAESTRKHLPLIQAINDDKLPHFASGGIVGSAWSNSSASAGASTGIAVNVIDRAGVKVSHQERRTAGGTTLDLMIDEAVGAKVTSPGSSTYRSMASQFGLRSGLARR